MSKIKKTTLTVSGMHCPSCEILIKNKFGEEKNIKEIKPNFKTQKVEVSYAGALDRENLNKKITPFGYTIVDPQNGVNVNSGKEPFSKRMMEAGVVILAFFILYFLANEFKLMPNLNLSGKISLLTVFLLGLVASTSTCMATSGALFIATIGKMRHKDLRPALVFNIGRVISYTFFGFLAGLIGKVIVVNFQLGSILTIIAAILMVVLGLDMLKVVSFFSIFPSVITGGFFERVEKRLIGNPKQTAFFLGAITYFLPCGFTQAVSIYSLSLADPIKSAATMLIFVLGTTPVLLALGFAFSLTKYSFYPILQKVMGGLILVVGIVYFSNSLSVYGINLLPTVSSINEETTKIENNVKLEKENQIARMTVDSSGYYPNSFTVKKNMPVKWIIDGKNVFGCQGYFVVPALNISQNLKKGENIFEFTPKEVGTINFSCGMGMYRGIFTVVD